MKVPIQSKDDMSKTKGSDAAAPSDDMVESTAAEVDSEAEERAHIEAAIRAGEEAAEKELAADAGKIRAERDELQKKLVSVGDEIESAKKEAADATDRLTRLQADWDNYRKRTAAERLAERDRATEKLVGNLLPVIDDMERAIEHANSSDDGDAQMKQFIDGITAVHDKMLSVLEKEGVETIDPAGQPFDPLEHQAVGRSEDAAQYDETVAQVYQKGYRMGGKVIRTAMVTVTYGGPKRPAPKDGEPAKDGADGGASKK